MAERERERECVYVCLKSEEQRNKRRYELHHLRLKKSKIYCSVNGGARIQMETGSRREVERKKVVRVCVYLCLFTCICLRREREYEK